jgi:uncharacterized protein YceH (UPF0502 family)
MTFGIRPAANPTAKAESIPTPRGELAGGNAQTESMIPAEHPRISIERLEKRIEELERRVAELEKKLGN